MTKVAETLEQVSSPQDQPSSDSLSGLSQDTAQPSTEEPSSVAPPDNVPTPTDFPPSAIPVESSPESDAEAEGDSDDSDEYEEDGEADQEDETEAPEVHTSHSDLRLIGLIIVLCLTLLALVFFYFPRSKHLPVPTTEDMAASDEESSESTTGVVTNPGGTDMKADPNGSSQSMGTIPNNAAFQVLISSSEGSGKAGSWMKVSFNGSQGWIPMSSSKLQPKCRCPICFIKSLFRR